MKMGMAILAKRVTALIFARDIALVAAAFGLGAVYMPRLMFLEVLNGALVAVCLAVCVVFAPSINGLFKNSATGIAIIRTAICGVAFTILSQGIGRVYFFEFEPSVSGRTFDAFGGLPAVAFIVFWSLAIVSIGMIDNRPIRSLVLTVLGSIAGGIALVLGIAAVHHLVVAVQF